MPQRATTDDAIDLAADILATLALLPAHDKRLVGLTITPQTNGAPASIVKACGMFVCCVRARAVPEGSRDLVGVSADDGETLFGDVEAAILHIMKLTEAVALSG